MIASVRGTVAALGPDGAVVEVGGVGLSVSCSPGTLARLRVGETGPAGDQPGRARGLADALRLRRRRRARAVRAAADRQRGRARSWPRPCSPCTRRASCAGRSRPATSPRSPPCPASAARAPSGSSSSCATASARSTAATRRPAPVGLTAVAPWRDQLAHALAGLGFSGKEAGDAIDVVAADVGGDDAPTSPPCCAAASSCSDGRDDRAGARTSSTRCRCWTSARSRPACGPKSLAEFVGQPKVREQLQLVLESALRRNRPPDHVLLSGPPGLGKTSLAMIIAAELGAPIRVTSGPAIERAGDLAALLTSLTDGEVLFIDEIHRIARPGRGTALHGDGGLPRRRHRRQGPGRDRDPARPRPVHAGRRDDPGRPAHRPAARPVRVHRAHGLLRPGRARAGAVPLGRAARRRPATPTARPRSPAARAARRASPTGCCAGCATTPRCAPTAWSPPRSRTPRWPSTTSTSSASTGSTGPSSTRWSRRFGGGPVGVGTLAVAVGEEVETVEEVAEPFLVRAGLLARTPRGRVATPAAWAHLGLSRRPGADRPDPVRRVGSRCRGAGPTSSLFALLAAACC